MKRLAALFLVSLLSLECPGSSTPVCLPDAPAGKGTPEAIAAEALKRGAVSEREAFVRLVFAETLASGCARTTEGDGVFRGIAWVVANRAADPARFGRGHALVTAAKQFRSTFGRYDVSRRREFLCPSGAGEDWAALWAKADAAWVAASAGTGNPLPGVVHYYLPRHFDGSRLKGKVARPSWASSPKKRKAPAIEGLSPSSDCIEFW